MSLMKTLTKVAIGIAIAKGVQTITTSRSTTTTRTTSTKTSGRGRSYSQEDLGGIMDEILGSGRAKPATRTQSRPDTGLDDLFGTTRKTTRPRQTAPKGGLEDILSGKSGGNLGDLLGGILGTTAAAGGAIRAGTGRRLNEPEEQDLEGALLLRCMIHAIKADGQLDAHEKQRLMEAVGDATKAEIDFINRELSAPADLDGLLADIPRGLEEKAYSVSLMAIDLDQRAEAEYLHQLATGLGLEPPEVNAIHQRFGAPQIYN